MTYGSSHVLFPLIDEPSGLGMASREVAPSGEHPMQVSFGKCSVVSCQPLAVAARFVWAIQVGEVKSEGDCSACFHNGSAAPGHASSLRPGVLRERAMSITARCQEINQRQQLI